MIIFVKTLVRGAVRERMLFRRLAGASLTLPGWDAQVECANKLKAAIHLSSKIADQLATMGEHVPAAILRHAFNGEF